MTDLHRPVAAAVGTQPQPAGRARAGGLRHRHPGRPRGGGHGAGPASLGLAARAPADQPRGRRSSTPSTARGAARPRSSSTPGPSPTTPGRCTTRWPPSTARWWSCTCPTPARRESWRHTSVVSPVADAVIAGARRSGVRRDRGGGRAAGADLRVPATGPTGRGGVTGAARRRRLVVLAVAAGRRSWCSPVCTAVQEVTRCPLASAALAGVALPALSASRRGWSADWPPSWGAAPGRAPVRSWSPPVLARGRARMVASPHRRCGPASGPRTAVGGARICPAHPEPLVPEPTTPTPTARAVMARDADVVVLVEYTPEHPVAFRRRGERPGATRTGSSGRSPGDLGGGLAVMSRCPSTTSARLASVERRGPMRALTAEPARPRCTWCAVHVPSRRATTGACGAGQGDYRTLIDALEDPEAVRRWSRATSTPPAHTAGSGS